MADPYMTKTWYDLWRAEEELNKLYHEGWKLVYFSHQGFSENSFVDENGRPGAYDRIQGYEALLESRYHKL